MLEWTNVILTTRDAEKPVAGSFDNFRENFEKPEVGSWMKWKLELEAKRFTATNKIVLQFLFKKKKNKRKKFGGKNKTETGKKNWKLDDHVQKVEAE